MFELTFAVCRFGGGAFSAVPGPPQQQQAPDGGSQVYQSAGQQPQQYQSQVRTPGLEREFPHDCAVRAELEQHQRRVQSWAREETFNYMSGFGICQGLTKREPPPQNYA